MVAVFLDVAERTRVERLQEDGGVLILWSAFMRGRIHGLSNSWDVSFADLAWAWFHLKDASQKDMRLSWRVANANSICWSFVHESDYFITWWTNKSSRWVFYYRRLLLLFPAGAGCQSILMWRHCADCSVTEMVNSWWPGIDLLQSYSSLGVWSTGFGPSYLLANVKVSGASALVEAQNVGQFGFWFYSTTEVACCPILWCSFCSGGSSGTNKLIVGTHRFGGLCMAGRDAQEVWMHTVGCVTFLGFSGWCLHLHHPHAK